MIGDTPTAVHLPRMKDNRSNLPNGNTLITISLSGYMYEIDSNQNVVWSKTISGAVTNARDTRPAM